MTESEGTQNLRDMITDAIAEGWKRDEPSEAVVDSVMKIVESVHENALGYGQLLGEERVLDAIEDFAPTESLALWRSRVKAKIEQGRT